MGMDLTFCFITSFSHNDRLWAFSMLIHVGLSFVNGCTVFFGVVVYLTNPRLVNIWAVSSDLL